VGHHSGVAVVTGADIELLLIDIADHRPFEIAAHVPVSAVSLQSSSCCTGHAQLQQQQTFFDELTPVRYI